MPPESDTTTTSQQNSTPATETTAPETTAPDTPTREPAPWEKEGVEFDADKAWQLVLNLREENKGLKERSRAFEDEKLSEKEKAERDVAENRAELSCYSYLHWNPNLIAARKMRLHGTT